ncbi:MAG TPA: DUF4287 domain-containing protein [Gemmatimonadaceae bacterium]|nr:DUF4287 domain-containing protein [Gemmatimonadaceae bacterium]
MSEREVEAPPNSAYAPPDRAAADAPPVGDDAVRARTGRAWDEWLALLDAAGGREMTHRQRVAYLVREHGVGPWWQQMVAVGYERARGLREKNQTAHGYQVGGSKTVGVPLERLYAAWTDARVLRRWLPDERFTVRRATPQKSLRISWPDGSDLQVLFYGKGDHKSQVTVDHRKLPDASAVERARAYWKDRLERLRAALEK